MRANMWVCPNIIILHYSTLKCFLFYAILGKQYFAQCLQQSACMYFLTRLFNALLYCRKGMPKQIRKFVEEMINSLLLITSIKSDCKLSVINIY